MLAEAGSMPHASRMRNGGGQDDSELLRFRCAGIVEDAAICLQEDARKTQRKVSGQRLRHRGFQCFDGHAHSAGSGEERSRVNAERKTQSCRVGTDAPQNFDQPVDGSAALRVHVYSQVNIVERQAVKRPLQVFRGCGKAVAESIRCAGENKGETRGPVSEIFRSLSIGPCRIGIVHALDDLPGRSRFDPRQG